MGCERYVCTPHRTVTYESVDRCAWYSKHSDELHANKTWTNTLTPLSRADPAGLLSWEIFRNMFICHPLLLSQLKAARCEHLSSYSSTKITVFMQPLLVKSDNRCRRSSVLSLPNLLLIFRPTWHARNLGVELGLNGKGLQCKLVEWRTLCTRKEGMIS